MEKQMSFFPNYLSQASQAADEANALSKQIDVIKNGPRDNDSGRRIHLLIVAFSNARKRQARALSFHESFATEFGEDYLSQIRDSDHAS
jgi:hypothetical protein